MPDLFPDSRPAPIPLRRQYECVMREVRMREHVYPRRVARQQMTQAQADYEIAGMRAVADTIRQLMEETAR